MDRAAFYDRMRDDFGALSQSQVDGTEALLNEGEKRQLPLNQLAYILSTSWHETAATMMPIAEYGKGEGHPYGEPCPQYDNQVAYGRGYVQLTWDYNYEKADGECSLNGALLKDFDLALDPTIASQIIFQGMLEGWFTGKSLGDYVNDEFTDYVNARRVVNGTDKADMLAGYAEDFEQALRDANYGEEELPGPEVPESGVTPEEGEHPPPVESITGYDYLIASSDSVIESGWELVTSDVVVWRRKR